MFLTQREYLSLKLRVNTNVPSQVLILTNIEYLEWRYFIYVTVPSVGAVDVTKNNRTVISCTLSKKWDPSFTFLGAVVFCVLVIVTGLGMLFCVKRYGIQLKGRHRSLLNARRMRENELTDARVSRNCIANGRTPLTYVIEEDEAPPPYYAETGGLFPVDGIEFPPPYTSRPTSVNGDFV